MEEEMGLDIEVTKESPFLEEIGLLIKEKDFLINVTFLTGFYGQSDCSSQLPLLDFMRLPDPADH